MLRLFMPWERKLPIYSRNFGIGMKNCDFVWDTTREIYINLPSTPLTALFPRKRYRSDINLELTLKVFYRILNGKSTHSCNWLHTQIALPEYPVNKGSHSILVSHLLCSTCPTILHSKWILIQNYVVSHVVGRSKVDVTISWLI